VNSGIYNLTVYISLPGRDPLLLAGTNDFVVTVVFPLERFTERKEARTMENKVVSLTSIIIDTMYTP